MAEDRTRRFSRLRPLPPAERGSGDLFAHFGVAEAPAPADAPVPVAQAPTMVLACPDCGWFRTTPWVEACPNCAAPPRIEEEPEAVAAAPDEPGADTP